MATAHINIGSNIGDRIAQIEQAVAAVERRFGHVLQRSGLFESAPWGYESDNRFLNLGVNIEVGEMSSEDVLQRLMDAQKEVDSSSHRDSDGRYADRRIDIDLIAIDDRVESTDSLSLPHPRMHLREFVLIPMEEIWPEWVHPLLGLTPAEMSAKL